MTKKELIHQIKTKKSFLCVGLDTDLEKIPEHLKESADPIFEFNKAIIHATLPYAVAYKPNLAFYEAQGEIGLRSLKKTVEYLKEEVFTIADAKRGDIGNTSKMYARSFFEYFGFDSVTVAPYMGKDSVGPFLEFENKWVILLALTSNPGAQDFQYFDIDESKLFEKVIEQSQQWGDSNNLMYVVGATRGADIKKARDKAKDHFLLVPGVGAQGGSLEEVVKYGMTDECGLLVNSSRSIIYASNGLDFAQRAEEKAAEIQSEMAKMLEVRGVV